MIVDIISKYKKYNNSVDIDVSYFNKEGKVDLLKKSILNPQVWDLTRNKKLAIPNYKNWDGKMVRKSGLKKNPNKFQVLNLITDNFTKSELDLVKSPNKPSIQSIDIEVEVIDGFPTPEKAKERITTIAIATENRKIMVLGWKPLSFAELTKSKKEVNEYLKDFGDWELIYKKFEDEVTMMNFFISMMMPKMNLIIGWNWFGYDWLYIVNRCKKLGINIKNSSREKRVIGRQQRPLHCGMYDYMELYKKYDRFVKIKSSDKLDYVAEQALGVKKLKYDGTIKSLFENQFPKYVSYNAIDAALVILIHEKIRTIDTPLTMANRNLIPIAYATSPVYLTENLLFFGYKERNMVTVDTNPQHTQEQYEGGYVKEPKPGMYSDNACFDFASLYPSTKRLCNISPESFVGKFKGEELEFYKQSVDYIATVTGAVFDKREVSVLKQILDDLYAERKYYKKRYLTVKKFLIDNGIKV